MKNKRVESSRTILIMADGTRKDVTDRFYIMDDNLFSKIVSATLAAGREAPVSYKMEVTLRDLTDKERDEQEYCDHRDAMKKVMGY